MSLIPVKYPLDLTGAAASNRVQDEPHLLASTNIRVFVPDYGAFFTGSITVRDAANNRTLVRGTDYYPLALYTLPTEQTGQEIHQLIVIVDQTCSANILFDGQMLGGEYSYSFDAIIQLINKLNLDNRPISFDNIIGKPDAYPPAPHLHDVGDVYGFEYVVAALERVAQALLLGSSAGQQAIYDYIDGQLTDIRNALDTLSSLRGSKSSVVAALGYTPMDKAGGEFSGPVTFDSNNYFQASNRFRVKSQNATASVTTLDLSLSNKFVVTLNTNTNLKFDTSNIQGVTGSDGLEFTLLVRNDGTAGRTLGFASTVLWPNKTMPAQNTSANAINEYRFDSYDGGVSWIGKLTSGNAG